MISRTTRVMIGLAGLLVLALPASAQRYGRHYDNNYGDGELRFHVGSFQPTGSSEYWDSIRNDFTNSDPSDFENASFGIDYLLPLNDRMSLMFAGTWYEGTTTNSYRGFEDNFNNRIRHDTTLDIGSATVGLVFHLLPRGAAIQPYIGAGGGAYAYRLQERGDFIDLENPNLPIFRAHLSLDRHGLRLLRAGGAGGADHPQPRHLRRGAVDQGRRRPQGRFLGLRQARPQRP